MIGRQLRPMRRLPPMRRLALLAGLVIAGLAGCAPTVRAPSAPPGSSAGSAPGTAVGDADARRAEPARDPRSSSGPAGEAAAGKGVGEPALLLADPPPACLAEIEAVAEKASGNRVLLGPAAFSSSDELVLTRAIVLGPDRRPLDGRMPVPSAVILKLDLARGQCRIRQVPAHPGSLPPSLPSDPPAPLIVTDAVTLPACRCRPAAP